jgi:hypothetical protein
MVRNSWLSSLLASLARVMVHGSLPLATAPQRFQVDGLGSCACRVGGCGFATVDNVLERGAVTPGKCLRGSRSGLATSQDRICSHSPSKGSLWVRRQPRMRFLCSCSWNSVWSPAAGSGTLLSAGSVPAVQDSTEKTRMEGEGACETKGEQPMAQRNTAFCNYSACWNRRMGSSAYATSISSCCFSAGRTSDRSNRCRGVFAES